MSGFENNNRYYGSNNEYSSNGYTDYDPFEYYPPQPNPRSPQAYSEQTFGHLDQNQVRRVGNHFEDSSFLNQSTQRMSVGYNRLSENKQASAPKKKANALTIVAILLIIVGIGLLGVAAYIYLDSQRTYEVGTIEYGGLAENVVENTETNEPIVDFAALKALNSEIVGWVQFSGTSINYPVVLHPDNDYYLTHTFTGQENIAGAIFMDYRCRSDLQDRITVIYGHHLKNGAMFAKIADLSDQGEFDKQGPIYYVTDDGTVHTLVPICCMVVNGYDVESLRFTYENDDDFHQYLRSTIDRSSSRAASIDVNGITHVYMFSTCSYAQTNDRTILACIDVSEAPGVAAEGANIEALAAAVDNAAAAV